MKDLLVYAICIIFYFTILVVGIYIQSVFLLSIICVTQLSFTALCFDNFTKWLRK